MQSFAHKQYTNRIQMLCAHKFVYSLSPFLANERKDRILGKIEEIDYSQIYVIFKDFL